MSSARSYDAVVVGSGPNGLAAGITLGRAGKRVLLLEAEATIGGGLRSAELTLPRFVHDVCSAIHPTAVASPFFQSLSASELGVEWIQPPTPLAHPFDDGSVVLLERSIEETGATLGPDASAYRKLIGPLVENYSALMEGSFSPLFPPRHPFTMARFGLRAMRSARSLAEGRFRGERARALFAGLAAHSIVPLEQPFTATFGLILATVGHAVGWPLARGGSQTIADGLARYFQSLGGEIVTSHPVTRADKIPSAPTTFFEVTPRQLVQIAGEKLPPRYRRKLERYRYGSAAFKMDWALDGPIPWKASACARAATVHLGGSMAEIAAGEHAIWQGDHPDRPFVILAQPTLFDSSRAPAGKHTAWAYCHTPNGSTFDMAERIEQQVERFAPGFRDRILARHAMAPLDLQAHNANYIGGDIVGGSNVWRQLLLRPKMLNPYSIPVKGWYLCSASTPPGGGVHGMCGYNAARVALGHL